MEVLQIQTTNLLPFVKPTDSDALEMLSMLELEKTNIRKNVAALLRNGMPTTPLLSQTVQTRSIAYKIIKVPWPIGQTL